MYEYSDESAPKLPELKDKDITLTLPDNMQVSFLPNRNYFDHQLCFKVKDLKWLSVWCRKYKDNFGTVYIGTNGDPDHSNPEPEPEAEAEPEPEAGSESEPNDGIRSAPAGNKANSTHGLQLTVISILMTVFLTL